MRMCPAHWADLRAAIDQRGLTPFVAADGKAAADNAMGQLQGEPGKETFDPLMNANWAIFSNALSAGGLYLMTPGDDGEPRCPLCEGEAHMPGFTASAWITLAADEQLDRAREHGLMPGVQ